jgi:CheY-like chemotaxis protein
MKLLADQMRLIFTSSITRATSHKVTSKTETKPIPIVSQRLILLYELSVPPGEKIIRTLVVDDVGRFRGATSRPSWAPLSNVDVIAKGRSGRDAIELAHEWMPDLVLMDVRMPDMTGLEAALQLTREQPSVVVILMLAFEDEGIWKASRESGAFAFLMNEHFTQELPRLLELVRSQKDATGPRRAALEPIGSVGNKKARVPQVRRCCVPKHGVRCRSCTSQPAIPDVVTRDAPNFTTAGTARQ